jgi:two-component system response regulator AtoC
MTPTILLVDDEPAFLESAGRALRMHGYDRVLLAGDGPSALRLLGQSRVAVAFLDITMPGMDGIALLERILEQAPSIACIMVSARDEIPLVMRATRLGAVDYLVKPIVPDQLVNALERALERSRMIDLLTLRRDARIDEALDEAGAFSAIVTCDPRMIGLLREAELHARSRIPVLVTGETGTGKELLAQAIHRASTRHARPFVAVNMLSLSANLFESEFFGHRKGAFTGAIADRDGYLQQAQGGTLFLDEIGDLPLPLQGKLLRILQEGVFTPVGGTQTRQADVRFIAATHQDMDALAEAGSFRRDLLYRLRFGVISIPPLRERRDDMLLLATRFIAGSSRPGARLSEQAIAALLGHKWPGNVRELKGVIEAAANLAEGTRSCRVTFGCHMAPARSRTSLASSDPWPPSRRWSALTCSRPTARRAATRPWPRASSASASPPSSASSGRTGWINRWAAVAPSPPRQARRWRWSTTSPASRQRGTRVLLDNKLIFSSYRFQRSDEAGMPLGTLAEDQSPMLFYASWFGLSTDFDYFNVAYAYLHSLGRTVSRGQLRPINSLEGEELMIGGRPVPAVNNGRYEGHNHILSLTWPGEPRRRPRARAGCP